LAKAGTNRRRIGDISRFAVCSPQDVVEKQFVNHRDRALQRTVMR
jgi:hypothetical protein